MPTADLAAQRALRKLADTDRLAAAASHQRAGLPEIAVVDDGSLRREELLDKVALAEAEVGDIDAAITKLESEIESVRSRADRDNDRLASGSATPKQMEGLQQELEALARRQGSLEEDVLELMERRESATAEQSRLESGVAALNSEIGAATVRRDDQWADIDDELARLSLQREQVITEIPDDVLAVYERVRATGKVAAAALNGDSCGACQMTLDRHSLDDIRGAVDDTVQRCPECSAIVVRAD